MEVVFLSPPPHVWEMDFKGILFRRWIRAPSVDI